MGYIMGKNYRITNAFPWIAYSFLLRGHGQCRLMGETFELKAPCVFMQIAGEISQYAPTPGTTWDEVFITYHREHTPRLIAKGFYKPGRHHWPIHDHQIHEVTKICRELSEQMRRDSMSRSTDRLDLLAQQLLIESLHEPKGNPTNEMEAMVEDLRQGLLHVDDPGQYIQLIAEEHKLSVPSLRRHWHRIMGISPGQYHALHQMETAQDMLINTTLPISQIAEQLGYADPLYFSRKFHKQTGVSPTAYREKYGEQDR
jgi:AraC-like DNA-binding protein